LKGKPHHRSSDSQGCDKRSDRNFKAIQDDEKDKDQDDASVKRFWPIVPRILVVALVKTGANVDHGNDDDDDGKDKVVAVGNTLVR